MRRAQYILALSFAVALSLNLVTAIYPDPFESGPGWYLRLGVGTVFVVSLLAVIVLGVKRQLNEGRPRRSRRHP